jgi:cytochrome bd-type quinol oxidase subunit 2
MQLDGAWGHASFRVMLQRNAPRHAHFAHAAVMGVHAICCGLPALAMAAAALSGAASAATLLPESIEQFHRLLHGREIWILGVSAILVALGAALEVNARRSHAHGFPWLFAFSVACFLINAAVILAHRG